MYEAIEARLGYQFSDQSLLEQALTHASLEGAKHYERLEFLGDAVFGCTISQWLYEEHPNAHEGRLSNMRTRLVRGATQSKIARSIGLEAAVRLGPSFKKDQRCVPEKALGQALEAVIGAVFMDGGYEAAGQCIRKILAPEWAIIAGISNDDLKNSKNKLQELLMAKGVGTHPNYNTTRLGSDQAAGKSIFRCTCAIQWVDGSTITADAQGLQKKYAEQEAAKVLLKQLEHKSGKHRST